jgi:hypothetical protein
VQPIQQAFDRIRARIEINERGCWIWRGAHNPDMYGQIKVGDKTWATHRVTYTAVKGEIPRGKVIRHTCDQRACCNPAHLLVGDHEDNTQDILDRGRSKHRRVLSAEEIQRIREMRASGETKRAIAEALHCNWDAVSRAIDAGSVDVVRQGRPRGSRNLHVRVTEEAKAQMRALYATGKHTQQALAEKFECDQTYVSLIVRGKK